MTLSSVSSDNGVAPIRFSSLAGEALAHGIFSRHGGLSPQPWDSLNVGLAVGDDPVRVAGNRSRIKEALGLTGLVAARQVHGETVAVVRDAHDADLDGVDALVTNVGGLGLMVQHADCQAVLLFDPKRKAVGIVHSGWRGNVVDIIGRTVATMGKAFGTEPTDLRAGIGPSLGPCCAEFINHSRELPRSFLNYETRPNYFDFWAISRDQLLKTGVKLENIAVAGICTVCDQRFFSYRREKTTGRNGSVIGLRP